MLSKRQASVRLQFQVPLRFPFEWTSLEARETELFLAKFVRADRRDLNTLPSVAAHACATAMRSAGKSFAGADCAAKLGRKAISGKWGSEQYSAAGFDRGSVCSRALWRLF
jgi:hypothetical protein